jgi:hypothetical protein
VALLAELWWREIVPSTAMNEKDVGVMTLVDCGDVQYYNDELKIEDQILPRAECERFPSQNTLRHSETKRQAALVKAVSIMLDQRQGRGGK